MITDKTLVEIIEVANKASFIGIDMLTQVKLTGGKANEMQGRITKRVIGAQARLASNYAKSVNAQLVREGKEPDFVPSERKWGKRLDGLSIVEHNGNHYLEVVFDKPGTVTYFIDGDTEIAAKDIIGLAEKKEGEQGGIEKKIFIRDIKVESLLAIRINKETYKPMA
jgi:hypothetical protein